MFTYRTLSFVRAFYPQKWQSRRGLEEQPARSSTHLCNVPPMGTTPLHHHLPQLISITCLPEIWVHHLVTPDWIQREEWVGRKQFEFSRDVKNVLGGIWVMGGQSLLLAVIFSSYSEPDWNSQIILMGHHRNLILLAEKKKKKLDLGWGILSYPIPL